MEFIEVIKNRAKMSKKTIVLPESFDIRILEAASQVSREGFCDIVLIGKHNEIVSRGYKFDLSGVQIVDPQSFDGLESYAIKLEELRKHKGITFSKAMDLLSENPLYFGVMMVKMGDADGMVAGAANSTADVLRPSIQILGTSAESKLVSSSFIMNVPDCNYGEDGVFIFSDCGLVQNPNKDELACIAGSSAKTFRDLVGKEPRVAMLSHSTFGSAVHDDVTKVVEATRIAKELYPEELIDGELQLDAAIIPEIGLKKAPQSVLKGNANVLVFPDLDSANIGYKLTQRLANAEAFGPITQGISKPVNDLSRGCSVEDIIGVTAITAVQAQDI